MNLIDFSPLAWGVFFPTALVAENNTASYKADDDTAIFVAEKT